MDLIYKFAELTIVAAAGHGSDYGLPGVSTRRRDVLDPFVLDGVFTFGIHPQEDHQYWKTGRWHTRVCHGFNYIVKPLQDWRLLLHAKKRKLQGIYSLSGIPFVVPDQPEAGDSFVEESFLCGLLWLSKAGVVTPRPEPRPSYPSWNWANVRVWSITWMDEDYHAGNVQILNKVIYHACIVHIRFDVKVGKEPCAFAEFAKASHV
ncbi:hypothetical protein DHEL01_v212886 [Diaporthe helianthi]|uniref:Uncharacterized protein n=1 Tax=Diaporthe helianthi TaxID=158607 RepID=A0A2P5HEQ2_DIAHE|nr:hypothetical protein DHEL01_v212886 [Diaporthe helianthi]